MSPNSPANSGAGQSRKERVLALLRANRVDEAKTLCEEVAHGEGNPGAWSLLGIIHGMLGNLRDAEACNRKAVELNPDYAEGHCNLGVALEKQWRLDEAEASYRRALAIRPDHAVAWKNLGNTLEKQGRVTESIDCYRQARQVQPDYVTAHSNELFLSLHQTGVTLPAVAAMHREWNNCHAAAMLGPRKPFEIERDPHRRLNLGFISGDLRMHPVGFFTVRAIEALQRENANLFFYVNQPEPGDGLTSRFRTVAHGWRNVLTLSDDELAQQIRQDRIDILFDLTGHNAANRLLVFARRPAPVQVSWAGYMATTGLAAMDYLIADRYEIPIGSETHYAERILRLPDAFICYDPPADAPAVKSLPASANGFVTFGCFNRLSKITAEAIAAWSEVLQNMPRARLILKTRELSCLAAQKRYARLFQEHGIGGERITYIGMSSHTEHLETYNRIDIQLDTFPYSGSTTTLESLWMGVPIVTLPNDTFAGRHSLTFLSNLGLTDWVAEDAGHYIELAIKYAADPARLVALRQTLRQHLAQSPICDGPRFAAQLMGELRRIWSAWCAVSDETHSTTQPTDEADAHYRHGIAQATDGRYDEAIVALRKTVSINPNHIDAQKHLAIALAASGKTEAAIAVLREIVRRAPEHADAYALLGNALIEHDDLEQAIEAYRHAVALQPTDVNTLNNLGNALADVGRTNEAITVYRQAIAHHPSMMSTYHNLGRLFVDLDDAAAAADLYRTALKIEPSHPVILTDLGVSLARRNYQKEAIACYRQALETDSDNPTTHYNLGNALWATGNLDAAMTSFRAALQHSPENADAHVNLGMIQLSCGNFHDGWKEYEWQWRRENAPRRPFPASPWNGTNLAGSNVFLHSEQGLGDELFFLRFIPWLKKQGAGEITYQPNPKIASILARTKMLDWIAAHNTRPSDTDIVFSVGDLPRLLGMEHPEQAPAPFKLSPLPEQVAVVRQRLSECGSPPYVGVTWRGGTKNKKNVLYKETHPAEIGASLKGVPATILILQRLPQEDEVNIFCEALGRPAHDLSGLNENLEQMLALLLLLDDYVGVSNTNMHLRAGVGKTARVLVPAPPEWRWMAEGRTSPWFPGFTVYRQGYDGNWDTAFAELAADLKSLS